MKIKNIKDGDVFIHNNITMIAVGEYCTEVNAVFTTIPAYWNKDGVYHYTSGGYKNIPPDQEVIVVRNMYDRDNLGNKIKRIFERLTFIPWFLIQVKFSHQKINLERYYKCGYCSDFQYKVLLKILKR